MAHVLIMPRQGEAIESSIITQWTVGEGDRVSAGDAVCEIETAKASFDLPAGASGFILKILRAEGEDVPALEPIAVIGEPGEDWKAALSPAPAEGAGSRSAQAAVHAAQAAVQAARAAVRYAPGGGRAIERGGAEELSSRPSTASAARAASAPGAASAQGEPVASGTAQMTFNGSAPAARILDLRARFKASDPSLGLSEVTIGDLVLFAVSRALPRFPIADAAAEGGIPRPRDRVHLAFAVDTRRGSVMPVIRDADLLSLREISAEAKRLASACRSGSVGASELAGGTFAVSNPGAYGVESFAPALDAPRAAILGVGAVTRRAAEGPGGSVVLEPRMGLSLTVDRRILDGASSARLLAAFADAIADIDLLLIG